MLALLALGCTRADTVPPNIVLVIADDQGWRDFGFMGSDFIHTPNLDTLAREGVVLTHAFNTASACRPSLQTLLTGLHPLQIKTLADVGRKEGATFPEFRIIRSLETLPKALARRGYVSFQGGKYWEGPSGAAGFTAGTNSKLTPQGSKKALAKSRGLLKELSGGDGTELGRSTMAPLFEFIDEHVDEPFFIWFAPMLPHLPHDPAAEFMRSYSAERFSSRDRRYFGNITRLDDRVGQLLAHLERRGVRERTLIIFLADNGWDQSQESDSSPQYLGGSRGKFSIYEQGFRTPIIFSWPGRLPAGQSHATLVSTVDLFPTILEFAGVKEHASDRTGLSLYGHLMDGRDFARDRVIGGMSRLRQDDADVGLDIWAFIAKEEAYFVRDRRWRYIWHKDRQREDLFEIENDPLEREDVLAQNPELARRFRGEIEEWIARASALVSPSAESTPP